MNAKPSIPRLAATSEAPRPRGAAASSARLKACIDAFSRGEHDRAAAIVDRMCGVVEPLDACERVLTPVARGLGDRWVADTCDFATLTLAMGRLHGLLHRVGRRWTPEARTWRPRRALLCAAPGEQHFFGVAMLSEAFRAAGWDVCAPQAATGRDLAARVRTGGFELVGLSLACDAGVEGLARVVAELRGAARLAPVVLVGGRPFIERPELAREVGADGTAADCMGTVRLAESLTEGLRAAA